MNSLLTGLNPLLITRIQRVLAAMEALGHPMKLCQGIRSAVYQHTLWLQGRKTPGPGISPKHPLGRMVTNCDGYTTKSRHQAAQDGTGHAVDCCFIGQDPFGETQPWSLYGAQVRAAGLVWGGDWVSLKDRPHAELP